MKSPAAASLSNNTLNEPKWTKPLDQCDFGTTAAQEHVIRLTLSTSASGGWTAKMGGSFGDRGKCEGKNVPPLELVIETRWPGVQVNWNGADPIL